MDRDPLLKELVTFVKLFFFYINLRLRKAGLNFEKGKNFIVDVLMIRRGANISFFVHGSILGLAVVALIAGGVVTPTSVVSGSYPGVPVNPLVAGASENLSNQAVISSSITPVTIISEKPRDKIVEHEVKLGETVSSIAKDYGVSEETILWENNLSETSQIKEGQKLRILPVSGVTHTVASGDTIYSIAQDYRASAQAIIDFPFNDIGDNFQLSTGQQLIIPDGAPPKEEKPAPTQYLANEQQNISISDLGTTRFIWPASGTITQYFSWYHPADDIANLNGGPILAADSGTVTAAGWDSSGYGNRIIIDHGNGYTTLYGHLSAIYVSVGQKVSKGDVIGAMGSTGRSTGTHLHIEIRKDGVALNPLSVLGK